MRRFGHVLDEPKPICRRRYKRVRIQERHPVGRSARCAFSRLAASEINPAGRSSLTLAYRDDEDYNGDNSKVQILAEGDDAGVFYAEVFEELMIVSR